MAPPKLARNAPVANILHPLEEERFAVIRHKADPPAAHGLHRLLRKGLHVHEPLHREQRFDNGAAAFTLADVQRVEFRFLTSSPEGLKRLQNSLARLETIQAGIGAGFIGHARVLADHFDIRQLMAFSHLEIVGIVAQA